MIAFGGGKSTWTTSSLGAYNGGSSSGNRGESGSVDQVVDLMRGSWGKRRR